MSTAAPRLDVTSPSCISRIPVGMCVICLVEMIEVNCSELHREGGHDRVVELECPACGWPDSGYECGACVAGGE